MSLLERAQKNIYRHELSGYLEERQCAQKEEEYSKAFADLDAKLAAGEVTQLRYDEIKDELGRMYDAELGSPYDNEDDVPEGGPNSIIFRKSG